ncbi:hypothetical protein ACFVQ3_17055 [Oerskovia sp. NPDC057915]|uniref:hypothetical protein n=1 Tax=Oerskovia sp. NPDC057915 TaxID=3346280 RepID=UPI0036DF003C
MHGSEQRQLAEGVEEPDELEDVPLLEEPDEEPPDELLDESADFAGAAGVVEPVLDDFEERESVR